MSTEEHELHVRRFLTAVHLAIESVAGDLLRPTRIILSELLGTVCSRSAPSTWPIRGPCAGYLSSTTSRRPRDSHTALVLHAVPKDARNRPQTTTRRVERERRKARQIPWFRRFMPEAFTRRKPLPWKCSTN